MCQNKIKKQFYDNGLTGTSCQTKLNSPIIYLNIISWHFYKNNSILQPSTYQVQEFPVLKSQNYHVS